jgi:hypothetical protein
MKNLQKAAVAAALLSIVPISASATEVSKLANEITIGAIYPVIARAEPGISWVALAASPTGRVFQSEPFNGEESARAAARNACEHISGRTCRDTLSVPADWDVVVLRCGNWNFLGGSAQGMAYDNALMKAKVEGFSAGSCRQIASY